MPMLNVYDWHWTWLFETHTIHIVNDFKLCLVKLSCKIIWVGCFLHRIIVYYRLNFINFYRTLEAFYFLLSQIWFFWKNLLVSSKFTNVLPQNVSCYFRILYTSALSILMFLFYFQYFYLCPLFLSQSWHSFFSETINKRSCVLLVCFIYLFHLFSISLISILIFIISFLLLPVIYSVFFFNVLNWFLAH